MTIPSAWRRLLPGGPACLIERRRLYVVWWAVCGCLLSGLPALATPRSVLMLYDERLELPGLAEIDRSFSRVLAASSPEPIDVYRETMDLSRFESDAYAGRLRDHLREKYTSKSLAVVIAVMSPSLDAVLVAGDELFPGTPIVFCGIERKELAERSLPPRVTGVLLKRPIAPTVEIARRLQPDAERIVVIGGESDFDLRILDQARRDLALLEREIPVTYWTELSLGELVVEVAKLSPRTIVLVTTVFRDRTGQAFNPYDSFERIAAASGAPVYGYVDLYVGRGAVGGRLLQVGRQGEEAARLTLRILAGEEPREIPVVEPSHSVAQFDWRQLRRWKLSEDRLPADAEVLFRPPSLWRERRGLVLGVVAILVLQTSLIAGLLVAQARRRRAESELGESEFRFRTLADSTPVMLWTSGVDRRITFVNRSWIDFVGGTRAHQSGRLWTDFVHPEDLERCLRADEEASLGSGGVALECRMRRHDGVYRWMLSRRALRFSSDGSLLGHLGFCIDISAEKAAAEELQRQRAQLAHVSRVTTLGELSGAVAHELKQPLSAILSNVGAAERLLEADPLDLREVREALRDIRQDDKRAAEILHRMRSLLQRHDIVRKPVALELLVEEIVRLMALEASERRVTMRLEVSEAPLVVSGDRVHLQQVVMNLVQNAIESMAAAPESGRQLTVRTAQSDGRLAEISVADTGPGIPRDRLPHLFEPFWTTKENGLGIGLSISRSIVEAHEGRIWAENNPGAGATFRVTLPLLESGDAS